MTKTTIPSAGPAQPHPPRTPIERAVIELGQHVRNELDQACAGQAFRGDYDSWIMHWKKRSPAPTLRIPQVIQALTVLDGYDTNDRQMRQEQARLARELLASLFRPATPIDRPLWFLQWIPVAEIEALANLDIFTVRDLLYHLPRRYDDRSTYTAIGDLQDETPANVVGTIIDHYPATIGKQQTPVTVVVVSDGLARMRVVFYTLEPTILQETDALSRVAFSGKVVLRRLQGEPIMPTMFRPSWVLYGQADAAIHTGGLIPIHPLTRGVSDRKLRQRINEVLTAYAEQLEYLPHVVYSEFGLLPLAEALRQVHFPTDEARLREARRRLAFDELLILQLGIFRRKTDDAVEGCSMPVVQEAQQAFLSALPFSLTGAQELAIAEVADDMSRSVPMTRLVQGDVGSGKTAVAMAAAVAAIANGYQVALMAPTELLAEQHLSTFREILGRVRIPRQRHAPDPDPLLSGPKQELFATITTIAGHLGFEEIGHDRNIRIEGLSGGMKGQQRRHIHAALARGDIDLVVGTHALISRAVAYARLGLVVVDEQHRFGVDQRRRLAAKGMNPHLLMLTATPIPRTTIQTNSRPPLHICPLGHG